MVEKGRDGIKERENVSNLNHLEDVGVLMQRGIRRNKKLFFIEVYYIEITQHHHS